MDRISGALYGWGMSNATPIPATIRPDEAAHFGRLADDWWDPAGSSAMLHTLNPVRLGFIRTAIDAHFGSARRAMRPLMGRRALDVGCGAGLSPGPSPTPARPGPRGGGSRIWLEMRSVRRGCVRACACVRACVHECAEWRGAEPGEWDFPRETVSKMPSDCLQNVFKMSSNCLKTAFKLSSECLQTVFRLSSDCQNVFKCLQNVFKLS